MNIKKSISTILILTLILTSLPVSAIEVCADEDILFVDESSDNTLIINGSTLKEEIVDSASDNPNFDEVNDGAIEDVVKNRSIDISVSDEFKNTIEETNSVDANSDSDGNIASGSYGNIEWNIDSNGKLTVTGNGELYTNDTGSYNENYPWLKYYKKISSAQINVTGATRLDHMFYWCNKLEEVDLSNLKTDEVTTMRGMFRECKSLKRINLNGINTSKVKNFSYMFENCIELEELDLKNFQTANVTDMSSMFSHCESLAALDLSGFNTSNVKSMTEMFNGCYNLSLLDVSSFNTLSATSMGQMFCGCRKLEELDISSFRTDNVTYMPQMFEGCTHLKYLDLSKFNTSKIKSMWLMFGDCENLEYLDISSFDTQNVKTMTTAFLNCKKLTRIDTSHFNTSACEDMGRMFYGCENLEELDVSGFNTSKVTDMGQMFDGCRKLKTIDVSRFDTSNVTNMFGMFQGCNAVENLDVSHFDTGKVKSIGFDAMFSGCKNLTKLDVSGFDTSLATSMADMFYQCNNLEAIDVSGFDTSHVTTMHSMFYQCNNLEAIDVSNFDTSLVTTMGCMFEGCKIIKSLDLQHFNTHKVTSFIQMFSSCDSLEELDLSNFDFSSVADKESLRHLCNCKSLVSIKAPLNNIYDIELFGNGWKNVVTGQSVTVIAGGTTGGTLFVREGESIVDKCTVSVNIIGSGKVYVYKGMNTKVVGNVEFDSGENAIFEFAPDTGYCIESIIVDGNRLDNYTAANYAFQNIQENHTLFVTFSRKKNYSGEFSYYSNICMVDSFSNNSEDYKRKYNFNYSDDWFWNNSHIYNHDLAKMSLRTAMAAMDYADGAPNGRRKDDNIKELMDKLDFKYTASSVKYPYPEKNSVGTAIGYKTIEKDGVEATLILVAIRGGGYEQEWGGNFNVRNTDVLDTDLLPDHAGFNIAATQVLKNLDSFVGSIKNDLRGQVKVWFVGYSRAAATANIAAARVIEGHESLTNINKYGVDTAKGVFAYCFECPQNTESIKGTNPHADMYSCIFNIVNPLDFVPKVAMTNNDGWNYTRYGVTYTTPSALANSNYPALNSDMVNVYLSGLKLPSIPKEHYCEEWIFQNIINLLADLTLTPHTYYRKFQSSFIDIGQNTLGSVKSKESVDQIQVFFEEIFCSMGYELKLYPKLKASLAELGEDAKFPHYHELCLAWMDSIDESLLKTPKYTRFGYVDCPVDVTIKDKNNKVVGRIINDVPEKIENGVFTIVDDDGQKVFAMPGDGEYSIEFTATGNGEMTYSVVEKREGYDTIERVVSFSDIEIKKGDKLLGTASETIEKDSDYELSKDGNEIKATTDQTGDNVIRYTVTVAVEGKGTAQGNGIYTYGQFDKLMAYPENGQSFICWDVEGSVISTEVEHRIEVVKDTDVLGIFTDETADKFYVGFDTQGANPIKSITNVAKGSTIHLPSVSWEGHEFLGWFTEPNGKGTRFTAESKVNNNMVLYAAWKIIEIPVNNLTFDTTSHTLEVGKTFTITPTFDPVNATNKTLIWESDNTTVATVADGVVTAKAAGTANIKATTHNGRSAICKVVVTKENGINSGMPGSVITAKKVDISVTFEKSTEEIRFKIKDKSQKKLATVSSKGLLTAKKPGTVTITVQQKDGKTWKDIKDISYEIVVPKGSTLTFGKAYYEGQTWDLNTLIRENSTYSPDAWETKTKNSIATLDSNTGILTVGNMNGTATVYAIYGTGKYARKVKVAVKINHKKVDISGVFGSVSGKTRYKILDKVDRKRASVSTKGILTAKKDGSVTATLQVKDGNSWRDVESKIIHITNPLQCISIDEPGQDTPVNGKEYVVNRATGVFHRPDCYKVKEIQDKKYVTSTYQDMINNEYKACGICKPD